VIVFRKNNRDQRLALDLKVQHEKGRNVGDFPLFEVQGPVCLIDQESVETQPQKLTYKGQYGELYNQDVTAMDTVTLGTTRVHSAAVVAQSKTK
jgi:hypothetical protein